MTTKQELDKKRSIGGLQALLATVRSLDPATTAELGALHNLKLHVAGPLFRMVEEALSWLENIDALVGEQMPTLGLAAPASSLPQSWRVLWQMSFSAQCELTQAARDLDLTGCGWEEGLQRCETAARQIKEALCQVVGAVEDLDHLERIEANSVLSSLDPVQSQPAGLSRARERLARGSEPVFKAEDVDSALRVTERYPEAIIEQLFAESERESLAVRTVSPPLEVHYHGGTNSHAHERKPHARRTLAPLTLDAE